MPLLRRPPRALGFRRQGLNLLRLIRRGVATSVLIVALYLLAALAGAMIPGETAAPDTIEDHTSVEVLLISGPIHYDFLLPLNGETRSAFAQLAAFDVPVDHPNAKWLVIGWGAQDFYTSTGSYTDIRPRAVWRALTGDASVLRVDVVGGLRHDLPATRFPLTGSKYSRLLRAIQDNFARDQSGDLQPFAAASLSGTDRFFAAKGRFHIFRTCNTWISRMIRASGQPFGVWTPTPYAVTLSLKRFAPD